MITDKIQNQIGIENVIVRGGKSYHLSLLKKHLQNILSGVGLQNSQSVENLQKLEQELNKLDSDIVSLEQQFIKRVKPKK